MTLLMKENYFMTSTHRQENMGTFLDICFFSVWLFTDHQFLFQKNTYETKFKYEHIKEKFGNFLTMNRKYLVRLFMFVQYYNNKK